MSNFAEIAYVRLTNTQKDTAYPILRRGASLLKKWAEKYYHPKKFRQFRNDIMKGSKNPQNAIPSDQLEEFHADLSHILAIRVPNSDLNGRSIEQAVLENFAALAKMHANQWIMDGDPKGITRADYIQEAYMAIIEAMYQYTRDDIDLSTFVWRVLRNRLINVTNQGNLFCPLTNSDLDLVIRYDRAKQKNNGGTFDEIVNSLGLSQEEGQYLGSILNQVYIENQVASSENQDQTGVGNDYTGYRSGIDHESLEVNIVDEKEHVEDVLNRAKLSNLEREVLESAMEPYYGWQTDFAKQHINPETGKSYSRMRITQVLKKAQSKVAKILESETVNS